MKKWETLSFLFFRFSFLFCFLLYVFIVIISFSKLVTKSWSIRPYIEQGINCRTQIYLKTREWLGKRRVLSLILWIRKRENERRTKLHTKTTQWLLFFGAWIRKSKCVDMRVCCKYVFHLKPIRRPYPSQDTSLSVSLESRLWTFLANTPSNIVRLCGFILSKVKVGRLLPLA